jgi:putative colanic acid biosysnthesis UDP-glucose lipid carrier transferase
MKMQAVPLSFETDIASGPLRRYIDDRRIFYFFKRAFDLGASSILFIGCFSWLFPLIALMIKLDSRGPVFFIQRRVGRGGKTFRCFKFRTMVLNPSANTLQAQEDDVRITRVGNFLRKSSLDELPQFLNVLLGQMSIVGPRPHMHADCHRFSTLVCSYKFRNLVKPGITGLAQIKGYRGPTATYQSIFRRYQYDAFYVRNGNFWLDMRIIRKTAFQILGVIFARLPIFSQAPKEIFADARENRMEGEVEMVTGSVRRFSI